MAAPSAMNASYKHTARQSILYELKCTILKYLLGILQSLKNVIKFLFKSHEFSVLKYLV